MKFEDFSNANILITNGYITSHAIKDGQKIPVPKIYQFVSEEKLRMKLEKVLVDN